MRLPLAALIALPLLLAAAPALADTPTDQTQASNATVAPPAPPPPLVKAKPKSKLDPNQVICKREEETGSRLGGHEDCMTRAQWDDLSSETQRRLNDDLQRGNITGAPKGGI